MEIGNKVIVDCDTKMEISRLTIFGTICAGRDSKACAGRLGRFKRQSYV